MRSRRAFEPVRPIVAQSRINEDIRVPRVRLVDSDGTQIGIKATNEALEYAFSKNLDLVEVAAGADPPVCRIMDYGKYRYEKEQKAKVKVTIMFRGRETTHPERGHDLLMRLAEDVKELGQVESPPLLDGRNMVMVLAPTKAIGVPGKVEEAQSA